MDQNQFNGNVYYGGEGNNRQNYLDGVKRQFSRIGASYTIFFIVYQVVMAIMAILYDSIFPGGVDGEPGALKGIVYYAMLFIPTYLVSVPILLNCMKRIRSNEPHRATMTGGAWVYTLFIIVFLVFCGNLLGNMIMGIVGGVTGRSPMSNLEQMLGNTGALTDLIFVAILAPIVEEFCFRKLLIDKIGIYGERNAMILSALIFALFHGNIYQFFYAFFIGLIFAYIYIRSGKIQYTIILHCLVNFFGGVLQVIFAQGIDIKTFERLYAQLQKYMRMGNMDKVMELLPQIYTPQFTALMIYSFLMVVAFIVGLVMFIKVLSSRKIYLDGNGTPMTKTESKNVTYANVGMAIFVTVGVILTVLSMFTQLMGS